MTGIEERIGRLADTVRAKCRSWVQLDESGRGSVVDPLEGHVATGHYAESHLAAALLIGSEVADDDFILGVRVLQGLLSRWGTESTCAQFHNDFNSFALTLAVERLEQCVGFEELTASLRDVVLKTSDSRHYTINWLPMRQYVNQRRFQWSGDRRFLRRAKLSEWMLQAATNEDGLIEDRLPKWKSFNLQYDIATAAGLECLNRTGLDFDTRALVTPLVTACDPTGDVNYLGRGSNQIFAWGPWVYLLMAHGQTSSLKGALDYLDERVDTMLANDNILLNAFEGRDRVSWWDYHFCSVYVCHFLLWLEMARNLSSARPGHELAPSSEFHGASGLHIVRTDRAFAATFDGRREYLTERGPIVANLWTQQRGTIVKGLFGPWLHPFGMKYGTSTVLLNFLGVLELDERRGDASRPLFVPLSVRIDAGEMSVVFQVGGRRLTMLNLPLHNPDYASVLEVFAGDERIAMRRAGTVRGPYGDVLLLQSGAARVDSWKVVVPL